ncbi:MAG: polyribonucleotide nucleotidyltransferase [Clostridia bacterium]|nr:polyribonucleotide nucleotidyltransferase [Clostridia bacterium]
MERIFETTMTGRKLVVETGKIAQLANGSCLVRFGDTVVLATATMSQKPREGIDFFPLSVDFEERLYSVGKIPGGFIKREGRPSEKAILASRAIDRPIRPLFPKDLRNDVSVVITVLSVDQDNSPEIAGMIGASVALSISDIPFGGPVAGIHVGLIDGEYVFNPNEEERAKSDMLVTVVGTAEKVVMLETAANQVPEQVVIDGILAGHEEAKKTVEFINSIVSEIGKEKMPFTPVEVDHDIYEKVKAYAQDKVKYALDTPDKNVREERLKVVFDDIIENLSEEIETLSEVLDDVLYKLQKEIVRRWMLDEGRRVDGRAIDEIRPLSAEVGLLPRTHGSGLFTRGQTQVLTVATLGAVGEQQMLDGIDNEEFKRYMHHYNFPSFSVGETRPSRGPGRREIGHGALAEKALLPVIPDVETFPYAIRLVSEVVSSNGSTSQGAICGSTLALMDAGVPILAPVAGISCGLMSEGDKWITMTDIQGLEDFFGDMDFKVAGTKKGITAIQMDLKNDGLTPEIITKAIYQTRDARYRILDEVMLPCIPEPRAELSKYAPKMFTMTIPVDKIREVIGSGGKVIQKIVADTGAKIDIEDDGKIFIAAVEPGSGERAMEIINAIVLDPEVGKTYSGRVTRLMTFGAFVEIAPGKEGLVHISKMADKRVAKVEDVVAVGDEVRVKLTEIDKQGRINLSMKDADK